MSLIEKALRRARDPLIPPEQTAPQNVRQAPAEEPKTVHSWPTSPSATTPGPALQTSPALVVVAVAVLALTAALLIGGMVWLKRALGNAKVPMTAEAPRPAAVSPRSTEETTSLAEEAAPPLPARATKASTKASRKADPILTGVVEGLGEPFAVINDAIVKIGEQVGEATLVEIGNSAVKLRRRDGTEIALSVPR